MSKKYAIPFQIVYLAIAGFMAVGALFSLLRGSITYMLQGIVMAAAALFFALFSAKEKLVFGTRLEPISDSITNVVTGNPVLSFITGIDVQLAWAYVALNAYFDFGISTAFSKVPVLNIVDDILSDVSSIFFFVFLIALFSLFSKKQYSKIALVTGVFTASMLLDFLIDFIRGIFTGYSSLFYSNVTWILFFGYLFALFNEYQDTAG